MIKKRLPADNQGFTLIETIVAVATISLVLPLLFAIYFTILQQQAKIYRLSQVKKEGDYALNVMKNIIRNRAVAIYSDQNLTDIKCNTAGPPYIYPDNGNLYFKDKDDRDDKWFRFYSPSIDGITHLASASSNISSVNLTSNKVQIKNLIISCERTAAFSTPIVTVSFQIQYNTSSNRPEETAVLNYQTKIKLRSY